MVLIAAKEFWERCAMMLKSALGAGLAFFALTGAATIAQAIPLNTAVNISIYVGSGSGSINNPNEQADITNPLLGGAAFATGTYTGALNFNIPSGGTNTIGAFLASGGGVIGGFTAAQLNTVLSLDPFGATTLWVFTGSTLNILDGSVTHDDGVSLIDNSSGYLIHAPLPVVATSNNYTGLQGPWTMYYVEANNLPAVLNFDVTRERAPDPTPLPAAAWMFGTVMAAGGSFGAWRKRRRAKVSA
jgi:hypothetical protein